MTTQEKRNTYTSKGSTIKEYEGMIDYCNKALAHYNKPENACEAKFEVKSYKENIVHYKEQIKAIEDNIKL